MTDAGFGKEKITTFCMQELIFTKNLKIENESALQQFKAF